MAHAENLSSRCSIHTPRSAVDVANDNGLSAELLPYAENIWSRFPEVFLSLGSPQLDDYYDRHGDKSWHQRVIDTEFAKVIEIRLPRRTNHSEGIVRNSESQDDVCHSTTVDGESEHMIAAIQTPSLSDGSFGQHVFNYQVRQQHGPVATTKPMSSSLAVRRRLVFPRVRTDGLGGGLPGHVVRMPELDRIAGYLVQCTVAASNESDCTVHCMPKPAAPQQKADGSECIAELPAVAQHPARAQRERPFLNSSQPSASLADGLSPSPAAIVVPSRNRGAQAPSLGPEGRSCERRSSENYNDSPGAKIQWFAQQRKFLGATTEYDGVGGVHRHGEHGPDNLCGRAEMPLSEGVHQHRAICLPAPPLNTDETTSAAELKCPAARAFTNTERFVYPLLR